jgi:RES domain-containing protein
MSAEFGGVTFPIGAVSRTGQIQLLTTGGSTAMSWKGFYLADSNETAWAEWYRALAELAVPPRRQMPRNMWRWEVSVEVADLSTVDRLHRVGLRAPAPSRASWPAYQDVGDRLYREDWPGLLAPSAARPSSGLVLCLFRDAVTVPGTKPLPPPRVYRYPPAPPTGMAT